MSIETSAHERYVLLGGNGTAGDRPTANSTMQLTAPSFGVEERQLLDECLTSRWVTQGPLTERFERLIAGRQVCRHAIAVTSCTAALHIAARAVGVSPGDEVIVPAFTWITSANAAEYLGAKAVFADIDLATYNLSPAALEAAVTPRTRAIVAVHLFGLAADMDAITQIARRHRLAVIEDAACALGTRWQGRPVGTLGDVGCFSFHPRKIVTTGEGGAATTNDDALAVELDRLRNHGSTGLPPESMEPHGPWTMAMFDSLGFNYRLSDLLAAVGIAQMGKLDSLLAERRRNALAYSEILDGINDLFLPTAVADISGHTFQSYVVRVVEGGRARRNRVMAVLAQRGIQTRPGTHAVHRLGYYREKYGLRPEQFPVAAASEDETIALPLFPGMTAADQAAVVAGLRAGLAERR
jgi:perosamine synthetase